MTTAPIKVLQVVGSMNRGGAETWLMHVLRHIDRGRFQVDFMAHTAERGDFDAEIEALGSRVIPCMPPSNPLSYRREFRQILREHGPYHVIHSHVHHFSGYLLWLAAWAGVPVRIAHSHLDTELIDQKASLRRQVYLALMKRLIGRYATLGLSASNQAAPPLFGKHWQADPRWHKFFCAIDLAPFEPKQPAVNVRQDLGIPPDAFVIGHVGRFFAVKNHAFILQTAQEIIKREQNVRFLLVGDGTLRPTIEQQIAQLGLTQYFVFTGVRSDVPVVMQEAMDVFFLPSLYEGLPLVAVEAQAAGLPCVLSDTITPEVNLIPEQVVFKPLTQPAASWAEALLAYKNKRMPIKHEMALSIVKQSLFNIHHSIQALEKFYLG